MAFTKDLGRVKGEDGDIYVPTVSIRDGYLYFDWELTDEQALQEAMSNDGKISQQVNIPIYVPDSMDQDGNLTFTLSQSVRDISGEFFTDRAFHVKGDTGEQGSTTFNIYHLSNNMNSIDDVPVSDRQSGTIYVKNDKSWFYDVEEARFVMLEGINLNNYYTKDETYSKNEINAMFNKINSQVILAYKLLDIENIIDAD